MRPPGAARTQFFLFCSCLAFAALAFRVDAAPVQQSAVPSFVVALVKPVRGGVPDSRWPGWLDIDVYSVEARADVPANRSELMLMLRPLLADRFRLKTHRETRPMTEYSLVVGKGGPRFRSLKDGEAPSAQRKGDTVRFTNIAGLAAFLSELAGRPVLDDTKLTGDFDIAVDMTQPAPGVPGAVPPSPQEFKDAVLAAAQEQTGLRLISARAAIDCLIVDNADKATGN
jgi:uncharacterized protein (TIGR03435 family)